MLFAIHPLLFNSIVLGVSLLVIFKAADFVVDGISGYAKTLGLSRYLIGFLVVSAAASVPEIIASITGIMIGDPKIAFGTIIGTNMVHLVLLLGLTICFAGKFIKLRCPVLEARRLPLMLLYVLPFLLVSDGKLSRPDGILMLAGFFLYVFMLWQYEGTFGKIKKEVKLKEIWKDALLFILAMLAIILAGRWLVFSAVNLAKWFKIPTYFISLTVIAIGSALPDFAVMCRSLVKRKFEIGIGEALGSALFELLFYFGIAALAATISIPFKFLFPSVLFLLLAVGLLLFFLKKTISWKLGAALVAIYIAFIAVEIIKAFA